MHNFEKQIQFAVACRRCSSLISFTFDFHVAIENTKKKKPFARNPGNENKFYVSLLRFRLRQKYSICCSAEVCGFCFSLAIELCDCIFDDVKLLLCDDAVRSTILEYFVFVWVPFVVRLCARGRWNDRCRCNGEETRVESFLFAVSAFWFLASKLKCLVNYVIIVIHCLRCL